MSASELRAVVARVAHELDLKRWAALRDLFADEVETDYSSLFGGNAQRGSADALLAGWQAALENVVTQHLLGPIDVDVARGEARCHVRALHFAAGAAGGDTWEVLGHYRFGLAQREQEWKVTSLTLITLHQAGNRLLLQETARG